MKYHLDQNHNDVAGWYRDAGCSVEELARLRFVIDLLVGCCGITDLVEIKSEDGSVSAAQQNFEAKWRGRAVVYVWTQDDVIQHVARMRREAREKVKMPGPERMKMTGNR